MSDAKRQSADSGGPLDNILFYGIIGVTGASILARDAASRLDWAVALFEKVAIGVSLVAMTFLVFNEHMMNELKVPLDTSLGGLWELEGQKNLALMLMVVVGFAGASIATRRKRHLAVDAVDRIMTPGPARVIKRSTAFVAMALCALLAKGSWDFIYADHTHDSFEGVSTWSWMTPLVNAGVSAMPGEKYGPGTAYETQYDWEDAKYEEGFEFSTMPPAFPYVETGDPFPLWIPVLGLGLFFSIMALRFFGLVLVPPPRDETLEPHSNNGNPTIRLDDRRIQLAMTLAGPLGFIAFSFGVRSDFAVVLVPAGFILMLIALLGVAITTTNVVGTQLLGRSGPIVSKLPSRSVTSVALAIALPATLALMAWGLYSGETRLLLPASILLALMGAPLFVSVGVGTVGAWILIRDGSVVSVVSDMFEATKKEELLAIPFFVLAGNLMTKGSIAARLIAVAKAFLGRLPGGLGIAGVLACAMFAAISGSSPVTVIAIGSVLFPMLTKAGYSERYSMGMLSTAGGLGIIIPPSIPMIVYAVIVSGAPILDEDGAKVGSINLDPTELFTAGMLPGAFIAMSLIGYTLVSQLMSKDRALPEGAPFATAEWGKEIGTSLYRGFFSLMLPVLILGGIYALFTIPGTGYTLKFGVTQAAAIAVIYALVVELFIHRELKWRDLPEVFTDSAVMMGSLFLIIVLAISLNLFMSFEEIPQAATQWMAEHVQSKAGFLVAVTIFLLLLGCVMDILSAILIVAPLLAPIAAQYGVNPVHFAIIFIVNLELGYLTPPMGINLFVASTVFERPITSVIRSVLPFLLLMLFCLGVIVAFPSLSLYLLPE